MAVTGTDFFPSTTDQDFTAASEVDIRKLATSAPGTDSTTICTHPTAAGTTNITIDPYSNRSTAGDITANAGWAINRSGSDGMVSTSTAKRLIPAGTWSFSLTGGIPAPGVTGSLTLTFIAKVYRVSSSGARTLMFTSAQSTSVTTTLLATTGVMTSTSSQSAFLLDVNETIHIGYLTQMVQVAPLGAVSGVATITVGTATEVQQVPTPGVRTLNITNARGSVIAAAVLMKRRARMSSIRGSATPSAVLTRRLVRESAIRSSVTPVAALAKKVKPSALRASVTPVAVLVRRKISTLIRGSVTPTAVLAQRKVKKTILSAVTPAAILVRRQTKIPRSASLTPVAVLSRRRISKSMTSNVTPSPSEHERVQKTIVASATPVAVLRKRLVRKSTITATATPVAIMSRKIATGILRSSVTPLAMLNKRVIFEVKRASVTPAASLVRRQASKTIKAAVSPQPGNLRFSYVIRRTGSVTPSAILRRRSLRTGTKRSSVTPAALLSRKAQPAALRATVTPVGRGRIDVPLDRFPVGGTTIVRRIRRLVVDD